MHETKIHICPMSHPGDTTHFQRLIADGTISVAEIQGLMITHEGDLVANAYAARVYGEVLSDEMGVPTDDVVEDFPIQAMAGAVGFMVPHTAVLTRREIPVSASEGGAGNRSTDGPKRLAVAGVCTRRFAPEEVGTQAYIEEIRDRVADLYKELEVESPEDVGLVFVKAPWPGPRHAEDARTRGESLQSDDFWTSGELARGGAALGVGAALGELESDGLAGSLNRDFDVYSSIAHCSSTEERQSAAIIMFANTTASASETVIGRCEMQDGLDVEGPRGLAESLLVGAEGTADGGLDLDRIEYGFLKPKTSEAPDIRGQRHTLMDHPTVGYMWWMIEKAPVHGAVAAALDLPAMEVATGPEHQGPVGQPLLALIARVEGR